MLYSDLSAQKYNSSAAFNYDLQLRSCLVESSKNINSFNIKASVYNSGLKTANRFSLFVFIENGKDSIFFTAEDELLFKKDFDSLLTKDSLNINFTFEYPLRKTKKVVFYAAYSNDMKQDNNIIISYFSNSYPSYSVMINEIMFNPLNNYPEYIELYNSTNDTINLINWKIADQYLSSGRRNELFILSDKLILPKSYLTISSDSSIINQFSYLRSCIDALYFFNRSSLNLNNDEDEIVLYDLNGKKIDSLRYSEKWHNPKLSTSKGISLEKTSLTGNSEDKNNWTSSTDISGGTPSKANSASSIVIHSSKVISVEPNPFSPDGDGHEDNTLITYSTNLDYSSLRIRVFDKSGRLQRTIINNSHSLSSGNIQWNGFDDNGKGLKTGIYILFFEFLNDDYGVIETYKIPVVIAKIL